MANPTLGICGALVAAFMFAVQYTPVKSYEVHDGITFQWFLACGSLFATILITAASGDLSMNCTGEGWMPFIGGLMFGLSNYLCIPLIKMLGMGVGFSMYHFINIMTGYVLGRIGFLGIPASGGVVGDIGCGIIGVSFILLANVEGDHEAAIDTPQTSANSSGPVLGEALVPDINQDFREQYRRWRLGESVGSVDPKTAEMLETIEAFHPFPRTAHKPLAIFRGPAPFAALTPEMEFKHQSAEFCRGGAADAVIPRLQNAVSEPTICRSPTLSPRGLDVAPPSPPGAGSNPRGRSRCMTVGLGVMLAMVTGFLTGSCATPAIKYNLDHPGRPFAAIFAMVMGFWFVATTIYVVYTTGACILRIKVPHAPIRPSFLAGALWAVGNALNIYNPTQVAYTVSYSVAIVGCLIIAGLISLLFYKEVTGKRRVTIFCTALCMQAVGVLLICKAGGGG